MKTKYGILSIITLAFVIIFAITPIIVFASLGKWPGVNFANVGMSITFWLVYGLAIFSGITWTIVNGLKARKETSIHYLQFSWTIGLQLLPGLTAIFFVASNSPVADWIFVIPLVIDLILFVIYGAIILTSNHLSKKMLLTQEKIKAESIEVVHPTKTFENEDGTFKGSRVKVNHDKDKK